MENGQTKTERVFDIAFEWDGKPYKGWVSRSDEFLGNGSPRSFHVVLNNTSFGYLSYHDCKWTMHEERPAGLVKMVGKEIEKHFQL